jgi:uncharacterized protein with von Willebrand factor type A (vWA) domain
VPSRRDLTRAVLRFGALLRDSGLKVTTGSLMDAVRALEAVNLLERAEVYLALRAVLMSRIEEQPAFDRCFDGFWTLHYVSIETPGPRVEAAQELRRRQDAPEGASAPPPPKSDEFALEDWDEDAGAEQPLELPGYSAREVLLEQDFSSFSPEQLEEVARLSAQIAKRLARRVSRRRKPARRKGAVDLRRSFRANLLRGDIIELRRRARRRRKPRLVLFCDVSGSMDLYSRFLLQFLYALQNVFGRVETFTFATRLTRVTDMLRGGSYRKALARLRAVSDWSGGTRIGEALAEFNRSWAGLVDRRTIVLLLSDGWDTGDPELLARELLAIKRRASRVLWLNPLLGDPAYEPLTRGMAAALPLVDHFAAAHNLASLRELAGRLSLR